MKRIIFLLLGACLCACGRYGCGVPAGYEPLLDAALAGCPRADSLRQLLRQTPREQREGMAFLIAHMPRGDRDTMRLDLLRENVEYAYRARREYPWTRALPDSVFLNEVLPYAAVDEVRDSWRADFYPRFARRVALCRDIRAAIDSVNRNIAADVGVEYNTAREKTNQSPAESMRQHMASCTGLSVLLVDALRAAATTAGSRYGSAAAGISRNITPRGSTMPGSFRMPGGRSTTVRTASSPCRSGRPATGFRWCGARTRVRCTGWTSRSVTATFMRPTSIPSWRREGIRR